MMIISGTRDSDVADTGVKHAHQQRLTSSDTSFWYQSDVRHHFCHRPNLSLIPISTDLHLLFHYHLQKEVS